LVAFCHGGIVPEYLFGSYILRGVYDSVVLFGELFRLDRLPKGELEALILMGD
jgi:hypothetical protein